VVPKVSEGGNPPRRSQEKAVERKIPEENTPREGTSKKRGANQLTPPSEPEQKKRRVPQAAKSASTRPSTSYADAASLIRVAILPKAPGDKLSTADLTSLEEAIVGEMMLGADCSLQFTGIHFRPGMIVIDCADKNSAEWLVEKGPQLTKWNGIELRACMGHPEVLRRHHLLSQKRQDDRRATVGSGQDTE
jgi:hypothetical protein